MGAKIFETFGFGVIPITQIKLLCTVRISNLVSNDWALWRFFFLVKLCYVLVFCFCCLWFISLGLQFIVEEDGARKLCWWSSFLEELDVDALGVFEVR